MRIFIEEGSRNKEQGGRKKGPAPKVRKGGGEGPDFRDERDRI